MLMIIIPLYLKMEYVLSLWLDTMDSQTVLFCRLMLIYTFILSISNPITIVMHATGYVKQYHLLVEIPTLAIMPITYILYKLGLPAQATYYTMIVAIIVSHFIRLGCLKHYYTSFDFINYTKSFLLRALIVTFICICSLTFINSLLIENIGSLLLLCVLSIMIVIILSFYGGLVSDERHHLVSLIKKR